MPTIKRKAKRKTLKAKRKLSLEEFTKCNPAVTKKNKCLPDSIYSEISNKLRTKDVFKHLACENGEEHCLLDKAPIDENAKKDLRKQYLRPRRPKAWDSDPDAWLDNYTIIAVMKQYQEAY